MLTLRVDEKLCVTPAVIAGFFVPDEKEGFEANGSEIVRFQIRKTQRKANFFLG
jgi:hypothetical protein